VEQDPESGSNAERGKALETAYGCVGGRKLCRVIPGADPAWNKAGRLEADEGARRLREPEGAGGREMQARPTHAAASSGESAEGIETSREALLVGVRCGPDVGFLENQGLRAAARCLGSL
jgi:hypothetical protein